MAITEDPPRLAPENSHAQIPIHVITGFLGSGKTTLLNRLLREAEMRNTAVIVNELGSVGIDHLLVKASTEDLVLLEGGCLCCSVRGDLLNTLESLYQRRAARETPEFTQVLVETTGLADPAPILRTLLDDSFVAAHYRLGCVLTTVDCLHADGQLSEYDESVKQAALAHHLVLTKTDLAEPAHTESIVQRLRRLNPAAHLHDVNLGLPPARELFDSRHYHQASRQIDPQLWLQAERYRHQQPPLFSHRDANLPHDAYIKTFCVEYAEPLSWQVLERWIQQLRRLRGKDLLRVKGIAYTRETERPVLIQGVQHVFQPPVTLDAWPGPERRSQVVFITRNISQDTVERSLHALIASRGPQDVCAAAMILLS